MESAGSINDPSMAWRMGAVEEQYKALDGKVDKVQSDLSDLKVYFIEQFASLRRDLFETAPFISHTEFDAYKQERDRQFDELKNEVKGIQAGGISTARHYTTVGVAIAGVFIAPFVADYLGRI